MTDTNARDELFEQIYEAITKDGLTWIEKSEAAADAILASGWADKFRSEGWQRGYAQGVRDEMQDVWGADPIRDDPYRTEAKP